MTASAIDGRSARAWAAPSGVAAVVGGATAWVAAVDPDQPGHFPICPFHALTGLWCPGCGSLRAVHALTRGDLPTAIHRNVVLVAALPVALYAWIAWLRGTGITSRVRPAHAFALIGLVVLFGVLRNLPGFAFLTPVQT